MSTHGNNGRSSQRGFLSRLGLGGAAWARRLQVHEVLSPEEYDRDLRRQRARADRMNTRFMILSFGFVEPPASRRNGSATRYCRLASLIRDRSRISDIVGWDGADQDRVGVILLDASADSASAFVEAVESLYKKQDPISFRSKEEILCRIFSYPSLEGVIEVVDATESTKPSKKPQRARALKD